MFAASCSCRNASTVLQSHGLFPPSVPSVQPHCLSPKLLLQFCTLLLLGGGDQRASQVSLALGSGNSPLMRRVRCSCCWSCLALSCAPIGLITQVGQQFICACCSRQSPCSSSLRAIHSGSALLLDVHSNMDKVLPLTTRRRRRDDDERHSDELLQLQPYVTEAQVKNSPKVCMGCRGSHAPGVLSSPAMPCMVRTLRRAQYRQAPICGIAGRLLAGWASAGGQSVKLNVAGGW